MTILPYDTLVGWLLEETERQPVLAVWEDLHWADPSILEMLGLMVDQFRTWPSSNPVSKRRSTLPATSLARLWQSQDKRQETYDLLAPVYG